MFQIRAEAQCFSELLILALASFVFWNIAAPRIKVWTSKWSLLEHPKGIAIQGGLGISASVINIVLGHLLVILLMSTVYQCPSPNFDLLHAGLTNNIAANVLCYFILAFHFLDKKSNSKIFPLVKNQSLEQSPITVSKNGSIFLLAPEEIIYVETANNCVVFHTVKGKFVKYQTLKSLSSELCGKRFKRVHRSYLVNINHVVRISKNSSGDGIIDLNNGKQIRCSRTYIRELPIT